VIEAGTGTGSTYEKIKYFGRCGWRQHI